MSSDNVSQDDLSGPIVDRRTTMKLLGAAGMFGLAGCTGGEEGAEASPTETESSSTETPTDATTDTSSPSDKFGGRLQAAWFTGGIEDLDPPYISVGQYFTISANIFNGLVTLNKDLTIRGDLAKDWTIEDDGKRFVFDLREGVKFHNGTEFTAEDVKYTITRTIEEETPAAGRLSTLKPPREDGVEVPDDYRVVLNFEQAMSVALIYLTRGPGRAATIVNQEAIEEMGQEQYNLTPVGTGPFQVTDHEVGNSITLDRFDDYFETDDQGNQLPYLDGVDIKPIPEAATLTNALRSGDIDFANLIPLQNVDKIEQSGDVDALKAPGINWLGMAMNATREPFDSRKARLGIAKVIDNEEYVDTAYFGNALPNAGVLHKAAEWAWREEFGDDGIGGEKKASDQRFDLEEGKRLLEEAGAMGANIGILSSEGDTRAAKAMRQQLNRAGLNAEVEQVTSSTYWERFPNMDYDVTINGSVGDIDPDQELYNFYRKPDDDGVWNWTGYESDEVHQWLDDQRRALDREERKQILWKIEDKLIEDVSHAYLAHRDDYAAKRKNVKGFVHIPFMRPLHTVWLEE